MSISIPRDPIGFTYNEYSKYAHVCKIAWMYIPDKPDMSNISYELQNELEELMAQDLKDVDFSITIFYDKLEGKRPNPFFCSPNPLLPYYCIEECVELLKELISKLEVCDSPKTANTARKLARKTIHALFREWVSTRYESARERVVDQKIEDIMRFFQNRETVYGNGEIGR